MTQRILSALIGGALVLFLTWLGGNYLAVFVALLSLLALKEFFEIGKKAGLINHFRLPVLFFLLWIIIFLFGKQAWLLPLGFFWFILSFAWYANYYPQIAFAEAAYSFIAILYPVGLFSYLYFLRELPQGIYWSFFAFIVVWATDTGAYLTGIRFGKRKLAPRVSPNKSLEGSIGGLIFALVAGAVFWAVAKIGIIPEIILLSLITSLVAQAGDLFESALKRTAGIKDSGSLIPGHGGILDRFDSFLFALPVIYFAVILGLVG